MKSKPLNSRLGWRLFFFLSLLAHFLEVALGHFAGGFRYPLLLDGLGRLLASRLDVADDLGAILLLEALAGRVTIKNLFALGIEVGSGLRFEGIERCFLTQLALTRADPALIGTREVVGRDAALFLSHTLAAGVLRVLESRQLVPKIIEVLPFRLHVLHLVPSLGEA